MAIKFRIDAEDNVSKTLDGVKKGLGGVKDKDIKINVDDSEVKELTVSQRKYNSMLVDTEKLLRRLSNLKQSSGNSPILNVATRDVSSFLDKAIKIDKNDAQSVANLVNEYQRLKTVYGEVAREQAARAAQPQQLSSAEQRLAQAMNQTTQAARGQSQVLSDLKSMAMQYLGVWGGQQFVRNIIEIGGQLEMQRLSIGAILGDMSKANDIFGRIQNLAVKSPFGVVELDQMTKQLSAYGFEYNELFDMTKRLADISAATGTEVSRLALALGHVKSEGALSGYTLRQFAMGNIPLAKKLSENLSEVEGKLVSIADVRKRVKKKEIGYDEVLKVMKELTDEGGMFYNAQEVMSQSVKAKFKNVKDAMDIMYGEMAEGAPGEALKGVASALMEVTKNWREVGAVILTVAGYMGIMKVSQMAMNGQLAWNNKLLVAGRLANNSYSAATLDRFAQNGIITKQMLLQAVATKKLTVDNAELAATTFNVSRAQLQQVATTGKVSAAMTGASLSTSRYTIAQLRAIAGMKTLTGVDAVLMRLKLGWFGVANAAKGARLAIGSMVRSFLPLLAITVIVDIFMRAKQKADELRDAVSQVGQSSRQSLKEINDAIKNSEKLGKPTNEKELRERIDNMKDVLEQNEKYTDEQREQVAQADNLSKKYDILLRQLKEMRAEEEWLANNEDFITDIIKDTGRNFHRTLRKDDKGGSKTTVYGVGSWIGENNGDITENVKDLNSSESELENTIFLLSEYQGVMQEAIEKNKDFGLSLDGKSWQEQIRIIAESDKWDKFVHSVKNAGDKFKVHTDEVRKASEKVKEDWQKIDDDAEAIRFSFMKRFNLSEESLRTFVNNNKSLVKSMVDGILISLKGLTSNANLIDRIKKMIYGALGLEYKGSNKKEPNEYDNQNDLGKHILGNVVKKYGNGIASVKDINQVAGGKDDESSPTEARKKMKENAANALQTARDVRKIYGATSKEYEDANKEYQKQRKIALANGITDDEIDSKKKKSKTTRSSNSYRDPIAEEWKERIRLLKDANSLYKEWEKSIGNEGALQKVSWLYGDIFEKWKNAKNIPWKDFKLEDVISYRSYIQEIADEAEKRYVSQQNDKTKNKGKEALAVFREAQKLLNDIDKNTFEEKSKEFASNIKMVLDDITKRWDIFNSIRDTLGNSDLAARMAGFTGNDTSSMFYSKKNFKYNRDKSESLRNYIDSIIMDGQFSDAIDFDKVQSMSEEQIDKYVKSFIDTNTPRLENDTDESYNKRLESYRNNIAGIIELLKEWKKLNEDAVKSASVESAKMLEDTHKLLTEREKINDEYEKAYQTASESYGLYLSDRRERPDEAPRGINKDQFDEIVNNITARRDLKLKELEPQVKQFYNSLVSLNRKAARAIGKELLEAYKIAFEGGELTAEEYSSKVKEVTDKLSEKGTQPASSIYDRMSRFGGMLFDRSSDKNREDALSAAANVRYRIENERARGENADVNLIAVLERLEQALTNVGWGAGGRAEVQAAGKLGRTVGNWGSMTGFSKLYEAEKARIDKKKNEGKDPTKYDDFKEKLSRGIDKTLEDLKKFQDGLNLVSNVFDAFGMEGAANAASDVADVFGSGISGAQSLSAFGTEGAAVGLGLGLISGIAQTHDKALERQIEKLRENVQGIESNTKLILMARERTLGFDTGDLRRSYAQQYSANDKTHTYRDEFGRKHSYSYQSSAQRSMQEYYQKNSKGTGYQQELANLKAEREEYMGILDKQQSKKKKSNSEIDETQSKIAELDDKIRFFTRDLAKELFNIDVKGWADQLSDALSSAFENGESMATAYKETVSSILNDVGKKMMQTAYFEKMFNGLQEKLDKAQEGMEEDPASAMSKIQKTVAEYFGEGGDGQKAIAAAQEFWTAYEAGLNEVGLGVKKETANTLSSSVQGVSEETAGLLAGYVSALRQDVAANRLMNAQFIAEMWPSYTEEVRNAVTKLGNIDSNVQIIRLLLSENGALYEHIASMRRKLDNITAGVERIYIN